MTDLAAWPALVLTAGLATRLRPLSLVRAKAAMPVAGRPVIARILAWLSGAGVRRVVLNLHHRPETLTRLVGDGAEWGLQIRYSWEPVVLGSAGGPRRALPLLEAERFFIVNGDTLTDCDLQAVAARHLASRALVTMAVVPGDVARYGGVLVGGDGVVDGFVRGTRVATGTARGDGRPPSGKPFHFIGIQAAEAEAFAGVPDDHPTEIVQTLYPQLIARRRGFVSALVDEAEFLDIGTAEDYLRTVALVAAREHRTFDLGAGCVIPHDACVEESILWDRVTVGRGSHLSRCIVADDVAVPDGVRYERCAIANGADGLVVHQF